MNRARFFLVALCAALLPALSGCLQGGGPATLANQTRVDERALIGLEASYQGARMAAEAAVDAGLVSASDAVKLRDLNRHAHDVLIAARAAYDTANAGSLAAALAQAAPLVAELWTLSGGQTRGH